MLTVPAKHRTIRGQRLVPLPAAGLAWPLATGRQAGALARAARHGVPIGAAALHFVLRHPAVTAVVAGARSAAEITEDARWLTMAVPGGLFPELAEEGLLPA